MITASGLQVPITYERGQVITASGLLCDYSDENDAFNDIDNFFKADPDQNKLNSDTDTDEFTNPKKTSLVIQTLLPKLSMMDVSSVASTFYKSVPST